MKDDIGVCKAKPSIREINPRETAAAYQLTNRNETAIKIITSTLSNFTSLTRLYLVDFKCAFLKIINCKSLLIPRTTHDKNPPNESFCRIDKYFPNTSKTCKRKRSHAAK